MLGLISTGINACRATHIIIDSSLSVTHANTIILMYHIKSAFAVECLSGPDNMREAYRESVSVNLARLDKSSPQTAWD